MLFYGKWVSGIALGESSWAFNLQTFGVNPFHTISVWLFGYSIIIYMMYKKLIDAQLPQEYTNIFIFFCMLDLSWFFISVFTHPQWWVILVPFIIAVLDNFGNIFNYILASSIHTLFLFYPMRWVNNIDNILANYIWVTPIDGNNLIILVTLMTVTLAIWIIDLWQDLGKNAENIENRSQKKPKRNMALSLIILIFPFALIKLMPLMREIIALIR